MASNPQTLEELDSAALFKLAEEKAKAEQAAMREEFQARIDELRSMRKEITARYRRDIAAVDRELEQLQSRRPRVRRGPVKTRRPRTGISITEVLISTIGSKESMHLDEIRERAGEQGLNRSTITQMLAYLKRTGRIESRGRCEYSVAA